jgi:histidine triad (HIT) family protein
MDKTLFQKIIDREIPSTIEYEDDRVIAIRDIQPNAPVHLLIIPKKPIPSVNDLSDDDASLIGHVFLIAKQLAKQFGIDASGYRIVTNVNADGGQTIFHLHFHLLGGEPLGRMNTASAGHTTRSASGSGTLREAGILLLCAIGMAISFNTINPARIGWMKKEFDRVQAGDDVVGKYLADDSQAPLPMTEEEKPATTSATETPVQPKPEKTTTVKGEETKTDAAQTFTPEPGKVYEITKAQFVKLLKQPHYLIDARTPEAYAKGYIADAVNFYGGEVEGSIPDLLAQVPRDRVIMIYCDGGEECELSHHVADVLKRFGYGPMFIYMGGWNEWKK